MARRMYPRGVNQEAYDRTPKSALWFGLESALEMVKGEGKVSDKQIMKFAMRERKLRGGLKALM